MKKISKRVLSFTLGLSLVMGNFAYANPVQSKLDASAFEAARITSTSTEKLVGFENVELNSSAPVRIIVELEKAPIIDTATNLGLHVEDMNANQVDSLTNAIEKEQKAVQSDIQALAKVEKAKVEIHQNFTTVFNGVSMTVPANLVEDLEKVEGIKSISIANQYERPEPQMSNSHMITQSKFVNEKLGYKGEGMVVAIIDTGLDAYHKDFNIDADAQSKVALTPEKVNTLIAEKNLKGYYVNTKVPYGWNYMDNTDIIKDIAPGASMHGMHVGGTVAANGTIEGVAPNAQLLALKVFGNDDAYGSTYSDIIIAAIDDGIVLGADVMNLSLGSTAAFVDRNDPEQQAVTRAVENGILMSISAGNSAHFGNGWAATGGMPLANNPDIGVSGAPGLTAESMQIASVDNATMLYTHKIEAAGLTFNLEGYGKDDWADGKYTLVALKGDKLGKNEDNYEGLDLNGKVALISRGTHSFFDKTVAAAAHGAAGVVCYSKGGTLWKNQGGWDVPFMLTDLPGIGLEALVAAAGGELEITVTTTKSELDPATGMASSFTSWGTTPDLGFKPDLAAPGGNIYSTFENDTYGYMSGTSMAAPHASGGSALVLQRLNQTGDFKNLFTTEEQKVKLAKAILMNTGRAVIDANYGNEVLEDGSYDELILYTSPRRTGAGSMDLKSATLTDVVVYDKASGQNFQASYNAGEITNGFEYTLTAYNQGTEPAYYGLAAQVQTNKESKGLNMLTSMLLVGPSVEFTVDDQPVNAIVVPAGGSVDVTVKVDVTNAILADTGKPFNVAFPNGNFVEGFVFFYEQEDLANTKMVAASDAFKAAVEESVAQDAVIAAADKAVVDAKAELAKRKAKLDKAVAAHKEVADIIQAQADYAAQILIVEAEQELLDEYILENGTKASNEAKLAALKAFEVAVAAQQLAQASADAADAAVVTAEQAVVTKQAELVAAQQILADLKALLSTTPVDQLDALVQQIKDAQANVDAIEAILLTLNAAVDTAKATQTAAKAALDTAKANSATAEAAVVALGITTAEYGTKIAALELIVAEFVRLEGALKTATDKLNALQAILTDEALATIPNEPKLKKAVVSAQKQYDAQVKVLAAAEVALQAAKDKKLALEAAVQLAAEEVTKLAQAQRLTLPLSVPFTAFKGDWAKAPAFDAKRKAPGNFYNMTSLLVNHTAEDSGYFAPDGSVLSPNGDETNEEVASIVSFLRNMKDVNFRIETAEGDLIINLGSSSEERKDYYDAKDGRQYSYFPQMMWDGQMNGELAPEGAYNYVIDGKLDDKNHTTKAISFSFLLDYTAPVFKEVVFGEKTKVTFTDAVAGIDSYAVFKQEGTGVKLLEKGNLTGEFELAKLGVVAGDTVIFVAVDKGGILGLSDPFKIAKAVPAFLVGDKTPEPYSIQRSADVVFKGQVQSVNPYTLTIGGVEVKKEAASNTPVYNFEHTYKATANGKQEVLVQVKDIYGNKNEYTRHFFVDTQAPTAQIKEVKVGDQVITPVNGVYPIPVGTKSVAVTVQATDNFPGLNVKLNNNLIFQNSVDYQSTRTNLVAIDKTLTANIPVLATATKLPLVLKVTDDAGWTTTVNATGEQVITTPPAVVVTPPAVVIPPTGDVTPPVVFVPGGNIPAPSNNVPTVLPAPKSDEITIVEPQVALGAVKFEKAYVNGLPNGTFNAEGTVTRAEFAKMIAVVLGLDVKASTSSYADANGQWYTPYVAAVEKANILAGYGKEGFKPNQPITRAEIAQALANAWTLKGIKVEDAKSSLKDIQGHQNAQAIAKLNAAGVISGYNNMFRPDDSATRAESVKMINVFLNRDVDHVNAPAFNDVAGHWAAKHIAAAASEVPAK